MVGVEYKLYIGRWYVQLIYRHVYTYIYIYTCIYVYIDRIAIDFVRVSLH